MDSTVKRYIRGETRSFRVVGMKSGMGCCSLYTVWVSSAKKFEI